MRRSRRRVQAPAETLTLRERMEGDFPLVVMSLEQENIPPHGHDFVELVYVNAGSALHVHAGRRYPIFAGDCFVVAPGESHGYEQRRGLHITNVLFFPQILRHHASDLRRMPGFVRFFTIEPLFRDESAFRHKLHLGASGQRQAAGLIYALRGELAAHRDGYRSLCTGLLLQLVVLVSRSYGQATRPALVSGEFDRKQGMVDAAIAYLEQHYGSDVSVADVARSAFISPSRLSHVFRAVTGMSLVDYLIQIRIDRAQHLLAETDQPVAQVSYELGIQSPAYFTRLFRRMTGLSPSEFRRSAGRGNT
jgi:AraC-like DNA-binding protein/mannose-6-phosphate isomerase-like protein (cupin superfamily)